MKLKNLKYFSLLNPYIITPELNLYIGRPTSMDYEATRYAILEPAHSAVDVRTDTKPKS